MDSRLSDYLHNPFLRSDHWEQDAVEKLEQLIFKSMEIFVIFMVVFFCFFVYYCAFGFIVGSIAEANMAKGKAKTEDSAIS